MTELELLKLLTGTSGGSVMLSLVLGYMLVKKQKNQEKDNKLLAQMIKADQSTREQHTKAITELTSAIQQFNQVNGSNQRQCQDLQKQMALSTERCPALKWDGKIF